MHKNKIEVNMTLCLVFISLHWQIHFLSVYLLSRIFLAEIINYIIKTVFLYAKEKKTRKRQHKTTKIGDSI